MIRAMIFDLDGTLVQTERLKARSYARAAVELCPFDLDERAVIAAFADVAGLSRREVAQALVARFDLEEVASLRMAEFGVRTPWQAYVQVRLQIYDEMLADPAVLIENQWPHNIELLHLARHNGCFTGLATMSYCAQTTRVLDVLELVGHFDVVATRDDVTHGKPDPEIYQLVSAELGVSPAECLVIEDSPAGVRAAQRAAMHCIAVTTPFTRDQLHEGDLLPARWIVDDPADLLLVVQAMMDIHARAAD